MRYQLTNLVLVTWNVLEVLVNSSATGFQLIDNVTLYEWQTREVAVLTYDAFAESMWLMGDGAC